jgi:DNA-directed RNA polymerase subunit omega
MPAPEFQRALEPAVFERMPEVDIFRAKLSNTLARRFRLGFLVIQGGFAGGVDFINTALCLLCRSKLVLPSYFEDGTEAVRNWGKSKVFFGLFFICVFTQDLYFVQLVFKYPELALNAELTKKAMEKVGNPNVLVNLVSRRVRQLTSGGGAMSRPLIADVGNLGAADIALMEIIEEKIGFELPEIVELTRPVGKKRKKH